MAQVRKVDFYRHNLEAEDVARATAVMRSLFLTTGDVVREFEESLARYLQTEDVIGVTSCTAALHLSLLAFGIGPGHEVITTPMSFVATANAVLHCGATPVFVDVEPETGNIDAELIEDAITPRTKAIIPVHLYGALCDMRRIREIADKHGLNVIEDAAHAISARRDGVHTGQLGDAACFSFYATKEITSGEGGAISLHDGAVGERLRRLRLHGMTTNAADRYSKQYSHWDLEECGWKYNMDNIQAAMLLGQLRRLEDQREARERICQEYERAFADVEGVEWPRVPAGARSARHLFTIWVAPELRDPVLWGLQARGVGIAVNFRAIHLMRYYRETFGFREGMFPEAERIGSRTISIPLYTSLTEDRIAYVVQGVREEVSLQTASLAPTR